MRGVYRAGACCAAPVPRPPHPISPTSGVEFAWVPNAISGLTRSSPAVAAPAPVYDPILGRVAPAEAMSSAELQRDLQLAWTLTKDRRPHPFLTQNGHSVVCVGRRLSARMTG